MVRNILKLGILFSLFLVIGCSAKYKWTKPDILLATMFVASQAVDGYTTDRLVNDYDGYEEIRFGNSKYPSTTETVLIKCGISLAVLSVAHVAPVISPKLRKPLLIGATLGTGYFVYQNYREIGKTKNRIEEKEGLALINNHIFVRY